MQVQLSPEEMKIIGGRAELKPILDAVITVYRAEGIDPFIKILHEAVLKRKIRYPVLEYAATELYNIIPDEEQVQVTDRIIMLGENGSEVIAGKILQLRLPRHYRSSIDKAISYISSGADWLCCDTMGERVEGHALLTMPEETIPLLKRFSQGDDKWIVRSVGVATHYAVKKGLKKKYAEEMFQILLSLAGSKDFHVKKGIGWAAKTIAKFHPDIIEQYADRINNDAEVKQWFKTKIKIGLGRKDKYADRYRG